MFFIVSMILMASLGYLAQTSGLCMVRGVNEAAKGKPMFLFAILLSGTFAWLAMLIVYFSSGESVFISYQASWFSVFGGFLFGLGAAVNSGCGVSTISRLARGQLVMLATVLGWLIGWVLFATLITKIEISQYPLPNNVHYIGLLGLSVVLMVAMFRFDSENKKLWCSMLGIGVMASVVFVYEPHWTPSGLLKDISLSVWYGNDNQWPSIERFLLMLSLIGGMLWAAVWTKSFSLTLLNGKQFIKHLLAGVLMGIGAVLASGGNDTQLLLALPAFSPAGAISVGFIILGIYLGRKVVP